MRKALLYMAAISTLTCCAEDPPTGGVRDRQQPVLIEDLPRLGGDYPPSLIDGLSKQLIDEVNCIQPGVLAPFVSAQAPGKLYTTSRIPLLLRPEVIDAAEAVAALQNDWMTITSGYRDVGMQYYDWLWGQRLGFMAARPGSSRHQAGQAIDVRYHDHWRPHLLAYGWLWPFGDDDKPHFEWRENNEPDLMVESVRAFQRLWNRNHPDDPIPEDGNWGAATEARMARTHAEGFPLGGCDLDGDGYASTRIGGPDCDDDDPTVHPGAIEICGDGIDQNCSGADLPCSEEDLWADLIDHDILDPSPDTHAPLPDTDDLDHSAEPFDNPARADGSAKPIWAPAPPDASVGDGACACAILSRSRATPLGIILWLSLSCGAFAWRRQRT